MKLHKINILLILIALMLFVGSCTKSNNLPKTLIPEATPTFSSNGVIPTHTPIPSPTLNIVPTLSMDKARAGMLDLLANNGNCHLPCLWGITPGKSSFLEARAILMPFTVLSTLTYLSPSESGGVNLKYTEMELEIGVSIGFFIDPSNMRVTRIVLTASAQEKTENGSSDIFDSMFYNEHMSYYMLSNILSEYGRPADVLLLTSADIPPQQFWWPFEIIASYPEQGILVHYKTPLKIDGSNSVGCPENSQIRLELRPAGSINSTQEFLESYNYPYFDLFRPIEEVTSLSETDFFEMFSQSTDRCIVTPTKYWPPSF